MFHHCRHGLCGLLALIAMLSPLTTVAGSYLGSDLFGRANQIVHPPNYNGSGGEVSVKVCIVPGTQHASEMQAPLANVLQTIESLQPSLPNLNTLGVNVPGNQFDFESVLLHEMGHCVGLAHRNPESVVPQATPHAQLAAPTTRWTSTQVLTAFTAASTISGVTTKICIGSSRPATIPSPCRPPSTRPPWAGSHPSCLRGTALQPMPAGNWRAISDCRRPKR